MMIKCEATTENFRKLLDDGYSFRFNTFLDDDSVFILTPEQMEQYKFIKGVEKIVTVSYEHIYLIYFMEHGLEKGFEMCREYAIKKINGDEYWSKM